MKFEMKVHMVVAAIDKFFPFFSIILNVPNWMSTYAIWKGIKYYWSLQERPVLFQVTMSQ